MTKIGGSRGGPKAILAAALLGLATTLAAAASAAPQPAPALGPRVATDKGDVRGFVEDGVAKFFGIPYAKPPVGALRWTPPQEPEPWSKPLEATSFGPQCLQVTTLGPFAGPQNTNEDCLYLNVFAPDAHLRGGGKLPVIVWIYGGGNVDGASDGYDGSKLARDGKTIVVTMNYRMNLVGFFAHPALKAEGHPIGNYGILDQLAVLKWVQANIAKFGGDKSNVSLGGQSAGSIDAVIGMTSPLFKGLFHRAILQSGIFASIPLATAETRAVNMAAAAGCGNGADAQTAKCLRKLSAQQIFDLAGTASANSAYVAGPIEDGEIIPGPMLARVASGDFNKMPVLSGGVYDDGAFGLGVAQYFRPGQTPATEADYDARIAGFGGAQYSSGTQQKVKKRYPLSAYESPYFALNAIGSDITLCTKRNDNRVLASQTPLFMYQFADRTAPTFFPKMPGFRALAYHTAELPYLFPGWHGGDQGIQRELTKKQHKLSDEMVEAWSNFAWTGNPNGRGESPWPRYRGAPNRLGIMELNIPFSTVISDAEFKAQHKCDLWDSVLTYVATVPK
ncbi:carboxylesterase/lipase family protein [Hansschlegelia zhihuaiae]|uniref:Carboxylic ester hydrolase n=1 Tax=Hansschlegelia zhihuaiae TaxID=405005 RepID=A0A4Q0MMK0_9HYPH|nr:carboxylesterase family protein [Hansschlegelia zhihuaiae]RXF74316.1 carboxylesterase family protein [Hansschlegelia zhihuaiae]